MQSKTYITEFLEEHLEQATDVLTRSFLELNTIWKTHKPKYEDVYPVIRGKILPALSSRWSFVTFYLISGPDEGQQSYWSCCSI